MTGLSENLELPLARILGDMERLGVAVDSAEIAELTEYYAGLAGLARTNPLLAFSMAVSMLSLGGIPLTGGFFGKFFIFMAVAGQGYIWLVVFAVLMSMVGIYYYLRPVIAMYLRPAEPGNDAPIVVDSFQSIMLVVLTGLTLVLGILPGFLSGLL